MLLALDHATPGLMDDRYSNFVLHDCGIGLNIPCIPDKLKTLLYSICSLIPRPLPDLVSQPWRIFLHNCKIKSGSGLGTRLQYMKFEHN